ncbi:MAG: TlpA disulfide reductase family protein [Alistipes sp.]|nr:redoxin domain-containing protein [Alistipes sp.]MBQ2415998.1 redoxin domain-containing protein [Alistipes sp.]MBQ5914775.1 redoxin domain-containing protein [Alistipes sp.]MBR5802637.1 redoxin domain-containing protein [Alistipes sp.]MEE1102643.1 TlpA disulfide reductase family protein [Alistipes sp.]
MKKIFFVATVLLMALSSCQSSKVKILGRFVGSDANMVYLERNTTLEQAIIDSVKIAEDGSFTLKISDAPSTPTLYNVIYNNERIPLLVQGGDKINVQSAGSVLRNCEVSGSLESELLHKFNKEYISGVAQLNQIISKYTDDLSEEQTKAVSKEYTDLYRKIKRNQLRFIIENKDRIAAIYALYQRIPNDANLFNGDSDVIYYRTVAEAIEQTYPESPYLPILRTQIARMDAQLNLLSNIKETSFPEIKMADMYGNQKSLAALEGNVILLHFWSVAIGNGNAINADLKEIYAKYHEQGFEIYQVGIDTSKAAWINAVQEQQLPWISVSDLQGQASSSLKSYNITKLPANYLIDRKGNIVAKDLTGEKLEAEIKKHI